MKILFSSTVASLLVVFAASAARADIPLPALWFDFDEENGTTAVNSGSLGSSSDGTISGPIRSGDSAFSSGTSLYFDGDTDFVETEDTFDYGDKVTIETWIKPDSVSGQRAIYDDYGNPGVFLAIFDGELEWGISTTTHPGPGVAIFDGVLCPDLWQHVAGTYDGSMLRAYVNGKEVGSVATSGSISDNSTNATHIGADSATPSLLEYAGYLDDLRLYLAALAPEELGSGAPLLVCGELNGDCTINTTDALSALRMSVGLVEGDPAADMNLSSTITTNDALAILRIAVGTLIQSNRCNGL